MTYRSPERTKFLSDLLATALEGGVNYWAKVEATARVDDPAEIIGWRYTGATLTEYDGGDTHKVTLDTIAHGINAYSAKFVRRDHPLVVANRTNGADGDYDALDADQALQYGLWDKAIYG